MKTKTILIALISMLAVTALVFQSCKKDNVEENSGETTELVEKHVIINLPPELNSLESEIFVNTLYSENSDIVNNEAIIKVVDNNMLITVFATNTSGQIVLLGMQNTGDIEFELSIESTAKAMVMLHPWAIDLTGDAKIQAMEYIATLPEYTELVSALTTSLQTDSLNPLLMIPLLEKILSLQNNDTSKNLIVYKSPLKLDASSESIKITNNMSSVGYTTGLYNKDNQLIDKKFLEGQDKSYFFFNSFLSGYFDIDPEYPEISFNYNESGNYTIRARNGLAFDGSSLDINARRENLWYLFKKSLSLINESLGKGADECVMATTDFIISFEERVNSTLQELAAGETTNAEMTRVFISAITSQLGDVGGLINTCALNGKGIKNGALKKLLGFLDVTSKLVNSFDTGAFMADWVQYDKSIDHCFTKETDGNIELCNHLIGEWEAFELHGTPIGEWMDDYDDMCPNIILGSGKYDFIHFNITETRLIYSSEGETKNYAWTNLDWDNCTYDGLTTEIQPFQYSMNYPYSSEGNTITLFDEDNGEALDVLLYEIQNNNTLILSDEYGVSKYHRK